MKYSVAIYIAILLVLTGVEASAQVQDSTQKADTSQVELKDDLAGEHKVNKDSARVSSVVPWVQARRIAGREIASDSLLRWQVWPNWGDFQAYRREVISFRQGTIGRVDAYHIGGYLPTEQRVSLEGISLNNPVTGLVNYNFVPQRKILRATEQSLGSYYSNVQLTDYYINEPVSYLNYDESKLEYRNLEFMVTQNFTRETNLELSYLDRRDGGYYPNNTIEGSQIIGRLYHFLSPDYQLRTFYMRNQVNRDEPFGYVIGDPNTFAFDRFRSQPNSTSGTSDVTRWDFKTGIYHRADTLSAGDTGLEISLSKYRRNHKYSGDTLNTDIATAGLRLFRNQELGALKLQAEGELKWYKASDSSPLNISGWSEINLGSEIQLPLFNDNSLFGSVRLHNRENEQGYEYGAGLDGRLGNSLQYRFGAFQFDRAPTIQAMHWQSDEYTGGYFGHETGSSLNGGLKLNLGAFRIGGTGRLTDIKNPMVLNAEGSFEEGGDFSLLSVTAYAGFYNHLFEIDVSGTIQDYSAPESVLKTDQNRLDDIFWIRNSFFVKGYAFDRAAFVKMGLKTLFSPLPYNSRTYNAALGYWQRNSTYQELPGFLRLDAELSARVRAIIVVMRWENVLDGLGQAGYFEAAGYPMPPRRLIIGIRARFVN